MKMKKSLQFENVIAPWNADGKNTYTVTGCIGFGIERFVLSFLSQYSEDEEKWPENIRMEYLGKYDS